MLYIYVIYILYYVVIIVLNLSDSDIVNFCGFEVPWKSWEMLRFAPGSVQRLGQHLFASGGRTWLQHGQFMEM